MTETRLRTICLGGLVLLFAGSGLRADDAETRAVAAIEKLGGDVTRNEKVAGRPVTEVRVFGPKKEVDACLKELPALKQLQSLDLSQSKVTDAGLKELAVLQQLKSLNLTGTQVTGVGLKELAGLKHLQWLNLGESKVTDAGLKEVAALQHLQDLTLYGTHVTDVGVKELAALKHLWHLDLSMTKVTDAGVKELVALKELTALDLDNTKVTDASVKPLAAMKQLKGVNLGGTKVTDAGIALLPPKLRVGGTGKPRPARTLLPTQADRVDPLLQPLRRQIELLELDPKEDELRRLLKERYNAAASEMNILKEPNLLASRGYSSPEIMAVVWHFVHAGIEVNVKTDDKMKAIFEAMQIAQSLEVLAKRGFDAGKTPEQDLQRLHYLRRDLEIQLLATKNLALAQTDEKPALAQADEKPAPASGVRVDSVLETLKGEIKLLELDPKDDELRRLLKERYNAAASEMNIHLQLVGSSRIDPSSTEVLAAVRDFAHARLEMSVKPADKAKAISEVLQIAKTLEHLTKRRLEAGRAPEQELQRLRYLRLDLEIQLLKTKREAAKTEGK